MSILYFIIALGILIFVHELGHFIMAKRAGVCVEEFSLGFGPRIFGIKKGETDYRISLFPLGGYVKLLGQDEDEDTSNNPKSYAKKTIWQRVKIISFGPLMNFFFALLVMPLVFMIGRNEPVFLHEPPLVLDVKAESPAADVGLIKGDLILSVDGDKAKDWEDVLNQVIISSGKNIRLTIERGNTVLEKDVEVQEHPDKRGGYVGIEPYLFFGDGVVVTELIPEGAAKEAGLMKDDQIIKYNNQIINNSSDLIAVLNKSNGEKSELEVIRDNKKIKISLIPKYDDDAKRWLMGVVMTTSGNVEMKKMNYGFFASIVKGTKENIKLISLVGEISKRLFTGNLSYKVLGGPVMIAKASAEAASSGLSNFLYFLAFLSMQLSIINLLPIPVLDGGHLMFLGIEAIKRKPVSLKFRMVTAQIGFAVLVGFILLITWNDLNTLFGLKDWLGKLF